LRVIIYIPTAGYRPYQQMEEAYTNAKNYLFSKTSEFELREYRCKIFPIHSNRNACIGHSLEGFDGWKPDTTIWIDADTVIPVHALYNLLKPDMMGLKIVAGIYRLKKEPFHYLAFDRWKKDIELDQWIYQPSIIPQTGLFQVDMVGMGCVRVDVDVLKILEAPYFKYPMPSRLERAEENEGLEFLIRHHVYTNTEEAYFWRCVRDKGFEIWVDAGVRCKHMTEIAIDDDFYYRWMYGGIV